MGAVRSVRAALRATGHVPWARVPGSRAETTAEFSVDGSAVGEIAAWVGGRQASRTARRFPAFASVESGGHAPVRIERLLTASGSANPRKSVGNGAMGGRHRSGRPSAPGDVRVEHESSVGSQSEEERPIEN